MTSAVQTGRAAASMQQLRLNLDELKGKTPAEQFRALGTAINAVTDPSQRAAFAMEFFGRSGREILSIFSGAALAAPAKGFAAQAQSLARAADLLNAAGQPATARPIPADDLAALRLEFAKTGRSAEELEPALAQMTSAVQTGRAAASMQQLGVNLDELKGKTPAEQFRALGTAINAVTDPSQRAAFAMELFGDSGAELLALFSDNAFAPTSKGIAAQAQSLARGAALLDAAGQKRGSNESAPTPVTPVDDLASLRLELATTGRAAEELGPALAQMTNGVQTGRVSASVQALRINLEELKHKTPAEQFRALGAAINEVKDPSQRAAFAMEFFGRSGAGLLSLFSNRAFATPAKGIAAQAQSLERDAALMDAAARRRVSSELAPAPATPAEGLAALRLEFAKTGRSAEELGPVLAQMTSAVRTERAAASAQKLGLGFEELKRKTPAEQFRTLGTAINAVTDPSQRAAFAMEFFGRSGAELLSLFSSDGFGDAANQVGSQAQLLARDAALFDDVSDKLALTGTKVRGFWVGLADKVAPVLKPLLDRFANLDLASWGQQAGEAVAFIVQAFADGKVGDILFTSAKIAFANAVNFLAGTLMAVAQALWQALVESIKNAITLFQIVTTADFWIGMGKAIMGIAQGFIAFLLDGIAKLLDYLSGIPLIGDKIGQGAKEMRGWADTVRESGQDNRDAGGDLVTPAFDKAATRMRDAFDNIGTALSEGFDKGNSLIDTSDLEQHLGDAVGSVMDRVQSVSEQSRKAVEPAKPAGPMIDPEEDASKGKKPAISAIQRIGGGGAAYGAGDPMLREQQRQTRELTTQTGLLRDVKRAIENKPTASNTTLSTVFA